MFGRAWARSFASLKLASSMKNNRHKVQGMNDKEPVIQSHFSLYIIRYIAPDQLQSDKVKDIDSAPSAVVRESPNKERLDVLLCIALQRAWFYKNSLLLELGCNEIHSMSISTLLSLVSVIFPILSSLDLSCKYREIPVDLLSALRNLVAVTYCWTDIEEDRRNVFKCLFSKDPGSYHCFLLSTVQTMSNLFWLFYICILCNIFPWCTKRP